VFGLNSGVCAFAVRGFYSAFTPMISLMSPPDEREKWFGRLRGARSVGITAGGGLASLAMLAGERIGLRLIVGGDASTYVIAAAMVVGRGRAYERPMPSRRDAGSSGYAVALADRGNVVLASLNVLCTILATAPLLALPVFVLAEFPSALWLPGVLSAVVSVVLAVAIVAVPRATRGSGRLHVLALSVLLYAATGISFALAGLPSVAVGIGLLFLAAALLGLAGAVYAPTADALPLVLAPPGMAGRYTAMHQFSWGVASVVSPILVSSSASISPYAVWIALAALAFVTAGGYQASHPWLGRRAGSAGSSGHLELRDVRTEELAEAL
jgi:hypothetical protein